MNHSPESSSWERLTHTPRRVPISIILRLMISGLTFGVLCFIALGTVLLVIGLIVLSIFQPVPVLRGSGLILMTLVVWLLSVRSLYFRIQPIIVALSHGQLQTGRITRGLDRATMKYASYESILEQFKEFGFRSGIIGFIISQGMRNWPVKIILEGATDEVDARLNLGRRCLKLVEDPSTQFLITDQPNAPTIVMIDQFPWLGISKTGEWVYGMRQVVEDFGFGKSLARSFLLVLVTYALVAIGLTLNMNPLFGTGLDGGIPSLVGTGVVLLFTLSHAVVPVFFYSIFFNFIDAAKNHENNLGEQAGQWGVSGFIHLHMGFWYGVPIVGLAMLTGWLNLAWVLLDVLRAGHGRRHWTFLQHGSTSMAMGLFLICFSGKNLFPLGIVVVVLQSLLLTGLDWKGRDLWVKD
ncbi:MAG: hypothetical protein MK102_16815 [Fuerstiella sp.]|nr:hypothetical protein [Fuerstiella sp.]